jgi:circadian clock protein KaiC
MNVMTSGSVSQGTVNDFQPRASTGVEGLDDIMGGSLPRSHVYLVEGNPGSGKTTLGIQFLMDGVARGESGLYVTLSETRGELQTVAASHGWSLAGMEIIELVSEEGLSLEAEQSMLHPSEMELGESTRGVMGAVERLKPMRVVFDSLSEMRSLAQDPLHYRRQILTLEHFFGSQNCTVLMLDDRTSQTGDVQLHSIAHGVLSLEQRPATYGPGRRQMRIVKLRGVQFRGGDHDFALKTGGIAVFPRLTAADHSTAFTAEAVTTGNSGLDKPLGGGLTRGSNTLFSGPSGVSKTTTAMSCVLAALERGEKATYYLFDEGLTTLVQRAEAMGIDIHPYLQGGQLEIVSMAPAEVSPGQFSHLVRENVEQRGARTIVIDSLNAYMQGMPGANFLMLQMHGLLNYLNRYGVVTIIIMGQHGLVGEIRNDVDLSYLSDSIVLFRFFESQGSLLKAVSAVKSRTSAHELTIREFRLASHGVEVGPVLQDFQGVLFDIPTYAGKVPLLSEGSALMAA